MKKKLAILLAATMALSTVPASVAMAASGNSINETKLISDSADKYYNVGGILIEPKAAVKGEIYLTITNAEFVFDTDNTYENYLKLDENKTYIENHTVAGDVYLNVSDDVAVTTEQALKSAFLQTADAPEVVMGEDDGRKVGTAAKSQDYGFYIKSVTRISDEKVKVEFNPLQANAVSGGKLNLPLSFKTTGDVGDVKVTLDAGDTTLTAGSYIIAKTSDGDTEAIIVSKDIAVGGSIILNTLEVNELSSGAKDIDYIELAAPNGFVWQGGDVTVTTAGGYTASSAPLAAGMTVASVVDSQDDGTLKIQLPTILSSTGSRGRILIEGLKLVAETDAAVGDVYITVKGDATKVKVLAATCVDYGTAVTVKEDVPTIVGGRMETTAKDATANTPAIESVQDEEQHQTAKILIKETTVDSWFSNRATTFTVPDGVKIVAVETGSKKYLQDSTIADNEYYDLMRTGSNSGFKVSADGTKVTLNNLGSSTTNEKAELELTFYVSVSPDFSGDVALTVGNSFDDVDVVIAKAVRPIEAKFKTTNVGIANKDVVVSEITLTENVEGALMKDGKLELSIDDVNDPDIKFVTDGSIDYDITSGDIEINKVYAKSGKVYVDVKRESNTASTIVIKGLTATLDRTPAEGNYALIASGTAIFANVGDDVELYEGKFDDIEGVSFDKFINVTTAAPDKGTSTTNKVAVTIGSTTYTVNGENKTADVAPIDQNNRTLVPLRVVSEGLGYQVLWSEATNTATIVDNNNRTAAFTMGSNEVVINGTGSMTMDVAPVTKDGRMLIPFRALGDALGLAVTWDAATNTATFN